MGCEYIIVQAGGKGSRLQTLTQNMPKALVSVNNLPIIFHLFNKFKDKKFIIIGDYKYDVLQKYLKTFAEVDYSLICSSGYSGTCAGLSDALALIPESSRFMLIWCDLILPDSYSIPDSNNNIIGVSKDFKCRWMYKDGLFEEKQSSTYGVAGCFIFKDKSVLDNVPNEGEFVRWLQTAEIPFEEQPLYKIEECGIYDKWAELSTYKCRPFNRITVEDNIIIKEGIDEQGRQLAQREIAWYKEILENDCIPAGIIPEIYSFNPLKMEKITGKNIYEYTYLSTSQKHTILDRIISSLKSIHQSKSISCDIESYKEAYINKTFSRLNKIRDLVPFADNPTITINGKKCRNVFLYKDKLEELVMRYIPREFVLIHGDCTFSNMMLRDDMRLVLIDPRGYFGTTKIFGDAAYDWVKLYYSLFSNYDQFNLRHFSLSIEEQDIKLTIASNNWEDTEDYFFTLLKDEVTVQQIKLLLAITWLSLTTYAWNDYDSICGAFYNGLYYLEEAFEAESVYPYFKGTIDQITSSLQKTSLKDMDRLVTECGDTLKAGNKIIVSGLGKNVPICEKFKGTMISLGLNADFLHTNSAVHGDMGIVREGDIVIILSKSGNTSESIYLEALLQKRKGINIWLLSCTEQSVLADKMKNKLIIPLDHEGDPWNIIPNNSTTLFLLILQQIAMQLINIMKVSLDDFRPNHPAGAIGAKFNEQ